MSLRGVRRIVRSENEPPMTLRSIFRRRLNTDAIVILAFVIGYGLFVLPFLVPALWLPGIGAGWLFVLALSIVFIAYGRIDTLRRRHRRRVLCPRCSYQLHESFPAQSDAEFACPECALRFGLPEYCSAFGIAIDREGRPIATSSAVPSRRPPAATLILYALGAPLVGFAAYTAISMTAAAKPPPLAVLLLGLPGIACIALATALWRRRAPARP